MVFVRQATQSDCPAIEAIAARAYAPYVDLIGRRPAPMDTDFADRIAKALVLVSGRPPRGYVIALTSRDPWHVENLAVDPDAESEGIARALMSEIERRARAAKVSGIDLYTNARMERALGFYPRLGYFATGRRVEAGFDRVFFLKLLGAGQ